MLKLPVGISSFEKIRGEGYLYIDKTDYIYKLIDCGKYYFLSRPRRFGKSLLVSVLKCLFEGRKELFKGLYIEERWNWDKRYPVILIDFNEIMYENKKGLEDSLLAVLERFRERFSLFPSCKINLPQLFKKVIVSLTDKYKEDIVILIDEYDRPIISHLGLGNDRLDIAKKNREALKEFYGVIKDNEVSACTKFVFLTGVSKFSQVSVFSELNNLSDITMSEAYSTIMGITEKELEGYLSTYCEGIAKRQGIALESAREKIKAYYNGYRFSERDEGVYNPFSLFRSFVEQKFQNFWFSTGTPTFLINLIRERDHYLPEIENVEVNEEDFSTYDLEHLKIESLLFQTGYLTIKGVDEDIYILSYPNMEVKKSFIRSIFCNYTDAQNTVIFSRINRSLRAGDTEGFIGLINGLFSGIAYTVSSKLNEAYFHTIFYVMVSGAGIFTETEVLTSDGRIDIVSHFADRIYIMEFKCGQTSKKALDQIRKKGYAERYLPLNKPVHLLGINFSLDNRNIEDWEEEINPCI